MDHVLSMATGTFSFVVLITDMSLTHLLHVNDRHYNMVISNYSNIKSPVSTTRLI